MNCTRCHKSAICVPHRDGMLCRPCHQWRLDQEQARQGVKLAVGLGVVAAIVVFALLWGYL